MGAFNGFRFGQAETIESGRTAVADAGGAQIGTVAEQATSLVAQHAGLTQKTIELVGTVSQTGLLS